MYVFVGARYFGVGAYSRVAQVDVELCDAACF